MLVKKFDIGDTVVANGNMERNGFTKKKLKIVGIREGFDDFLLDLIDEDTKEKYGGYYQFRFDLVKTRKKGNYEQYNRDRQ